MPKLTAGRHLKHRNLSPKPLIRAVNALLSHNFLHCQMRI